MVILPCLHIIRPSNVAIDLSRSTFLEIACDQCARTFRIYIVDTGADRAVRANQLTRASYEEWRKVE